MNEPIGDAYGYGDEGGNAGFGGNFLGQLPVILWERRWLVLIPFVIGLSAAVAAALLLPPVYRSTATMLVQSSQLPQNVTGGDNNELVDRRIARIREQVTSRPDLVALIEKYGLYDAERGRKPLSSVIEDMRDAIALKPTVADVPNSRANERTIAFQLTYEYRQPGPAQQVTQELMQRILELDSTATAEQATNTVQFLGDQARGLEEQIAQVQGQIASITSRYGGVLARGTGVSMVGSSGGSYDVQIAQLQRDNAQLIAQRNLAKTADARDPVVTAAEAQLAAAQAVYADSHPDVVIAKQRLAEARQLARNNVGKLPADNTDQQIAFNNSQIAQLQAAKARDAAQVSATMSAQSQAPAVQQQITELQQQLSALNERYKTVSERLMAARAGVRADDQQMGERLSIVEPPVVPDKPIKPNRLLILGVGTLAGLGLGLVLALAMEFLMRPLRDPDAVASAVGAAPIGMVPIIKKNGAKDGARRTGGLFKRPAFVRRGVN